MKLKEYLISILEDSMDDYSDAPASEYRKIGIDKKLIKKPVHGNTVTVNRQADKNENPRYEPNDSCGYTEH